MGPKEKNDDFNESIIEDSVSEEKDIEDNVSEENFEELPQDENSGLISINGGNLHKGIKNVFLDLDNTLISSEPLDTFDVKKYKEKIGMFPQHYMENLYIVFERPGLQDFLDYLFSNFNVSVWTAATKDYALFIIDNIVLGGKGVSSGKRENEREETKKDRKLNWTLFSYHCDWSEKRKKGIKGLSLLWDGVNLPGITSENTLIIDDLPEVSKIQPQNSIRVKPFEFKDANSENDNELERVRNILEVVKG